MSDESPTDGTPVGYRYAEQHTPPEPVRVSDVALTTHPHVFEVDPRLMERWVLQQTFPNWDSLRIMNSRHDHLEWMHRHFASKVLTGSELLSEVEAETDQGSTGSPISRPQSAPTPSSRSPWPTGQREPTKEEP